MNLKFLMSAGCLLVALSGLMTGCSEGNYTPNTVSPNGNPYGPNGYQTGFNNGFNNGYNNGFNTPGYNNGYNNGMMNQNPCSFVASSYYPCNPSVYQNPCGNGLNYNVLYNPYIYSPCQMSQAQLQLRAQLMWNWSYRMNSNFYYPMTPASNCVLQRYPTYTPSRCACFRAPCDCERVIRSYRRTYTRTYVTHHHYSSDSGSLPDSSSGPSGGDLPPSNPPTNSGSTWNGELYVSTGDNSKDAEQLYIRMGIKPIEDKANDTLTKVGIGLECTHFKKPAKDAPEYECHFTLTTADVAGETLRGKVKEFKSLAELSSVLDHSEVTVDNATNEYAGSFVTVLRQKPGVAIIKGQGSAAEKFLDGTKASYEDVFKRLKEKNPAGDANIAIGKEVKCTRDLTKTEPYTCEIRFLIETGKPLEVNSSEWLLPGEVASI